MDASHVYVGARLLPQSYQYPNLSEGADHVSGQLRGDEECPFSAVNQIWQSLEEGAGKRRWDCAIVVVDWLDCSAIRLRSQAHSLRSCSSRSL